MMRCSQARRRILASRDARLSLAERLELDEHLQGCSACRTLDAADASLDEALAALPEPPVERLDVEAAVRAVRVRIDESEVERAAERARRARVGKWIAWAVAAAVAAALGAWAFVGRGASVPERRDEIVEREPGSAPAELGGGAALELDVRSTEDAVAQDSGSGQAPGVELEAPAPNRLADVEPVQSDPSQAQRAQSELAQSQLERTDPSQTEVSLGELTQSELSHGELAQADVDLGSSASADEAPLDVERHDRARADVRAAFAQATATYVGSGEDAAVLAARLKAVELPLKALADEGWNVAALAERVVADPDAEVAGLAARWLGPKGDRLALRTIAGVLRRPDAPLALRRQAALALLDDGEPGIEALGPALADAQLRSLVLERLAGKTGPATITAVAKALESARADDVAAAELAHALAGFGVSGVDALIEAVRHGGSAAEAALSELRRTRGAPERVAALLVERSSARQLDVRVATAARLGLSEVLPLLRERALDRSRRASALAQLGAFEGRGALAIVLDLWGSSRFGEDELGAAARSILARDPREGVALANELETAQAAESLHHLLDLTLASESKAAAPTLARLVASPLLATDERQWAAVALAELGTAAEVRALTEALRELELTQARLAASCALAIHALGGEPALREALALEHAPSAARLIELFERRPEDRHPAATLSRAARLLEPWLASQSTQRSRTTP